MVNELAAAWRRKVKYYQRLLRLGQWTLFPQVAELDPQYGASTTTCAGSYQATVSLNPAALTDKNPRLITAGGSSMVMFPNSIDELALHELLHLLANGFESVDSRIAEMLGPDHDALIAGRDEAFERFLSAVAGIIARLAPERKGE